MTFGCLGTGKLEPKKIYERTIRKKIPKKEERGKAYLLFDLKYCFVLRRLKLGRNVCLCERVCAEVLVSRSLIWKPPPCYGM